MKKYLEKYGKSNKTRFHMPGHKGKNIFNQDYNINKIDITEIDGSDNLHNPKGIIKESLEKAKKLFGTKETFYLINGSTSGIQIGIMGTFTPNDKILIQRDSHISVYNSAIITGLELKYLKSYYDKKTGINIGIDIQELEKELKEDSDIKGVFITYPTYYGVCSDLQKIAYIIRKYNRILIVDEAHGSHFKFHRKLPKSAIDIGGDLVIQSTHKTLTGFTQTAMLHICTDNIDKKRIKETFNLLQTTSPSYILMNSLDWTVRNLLESKDNLFDRLIENIDKLKEEVEKLSTINIIDKNSFGNKKIEFDISKIILEKRNCTGTQLKEYLKKEDIEIEMTDFRYCILLSSLEDTKEDFDILIKALKKIDKIEIKENTKDKNIEYNIPKKELEIREAFFKEKEFLELRESCNKISGGFLVPYPPGVPLLVPGERVEKNIIEKIEKYRENGSDIIGLEKNKIKVLKGK